MQWLRESIQLNVVCLWCAVLPGSPTCAGRMSDELQTCQHLLHLSGVGSLQGFIARAVSAPVRLLDKEEEVENAKHSRELLKGKQIKVVSSQSLQSGQSLLARTKLMWVHPSSWQGFPSTEECQNGWSPCQQSCRDQDWEGSGTWANVSHLFPAHTLSTLSCLGGCKIIHTIAFLSTVFFFSSGKTVNTTPEKC